ncbi:hypothetical protein HNQ51_000906 [Inhella inkyongensis]|uniref:Type 4 fimbrial biogenesis protein PilX N-terminal domain-containing protein n=1 Tax=Inhella inkyongensis TaxID=392593 RepID=A0A840S1J3_9BURK|nr:hypothetical protein [Inhella inkyongensis]MBB5203613.1 hypothetical protein [Inhella inkyongensis]
MALIFLLVFAVMAATMFRSSLTSVQALGNMQSRNETINAANDALDKVLSSADFATNPAVLTAETNKAPFRLDVNGDGVNDISVDFPVVTIDGKAKAGPRCLRVEPVPKSQIDPDSEQMRQCSGEDGSSHSGLGQQTGSGSSPVNQGLSGCSNTEWSITMQARDEVTNARVNVVQGVGVRVPTASVSTCE